MLSVAQVNAAIARQAEAHGVDLKQEGVRGLVRNVAQVILGHWHWEHQELCRLRDLRLALEAAAKSGTTLTVANEQLADLERFYARRRRIDEACP